MATPLSATLRSINRHEGAPLQILTINDNEELQVALSKTKNYFTFINHPQIRPWDTTIRDIPKNCHILQNENVNKQLKMDMVFDLIICCNRHSQYGILKQLSTQMNCPIMNIQYDLSPPDINTFYAQSLADQLYDITVFDSKFTANSWGFDTDESDIIVIPYGVNTDYWIGWVGGDGKVMTSVSDYGHRNAICGFDLYKEVTDDLPTNPWGETPGLSKMATNTDHLRELYRHASVYLNTTLWSSCPFSLLEAMSVGCPIVTTATTSMPEFIENGVNGFITNDPVTMKENLKDLIEDQDMALEIGAAGRETILEQFGQQQFIIAWDKAFLRAANCPAGQ